MSLQGFFTNKFLKFISSRASRKNVCLIRDTKILMIRSIKIENSCDILKLEEMVMSYNLQTYQTTFECGFTYAWELFYECQERKIQNER